MYNLHHPYRLLLWQLLCIQLFIWTCKASYSLVVETGSSECVSIRVPNDRPSVISGNYDMLDDNVPASALSVYLEKIKPTGHEAEIWRSVEDDREGIFSISVDADGRYNLCFTADEVEQDDEAEEEDIEHVLVGFNIRLQTLPRTLPEGEIGPDAQRALDLVESAGLVQVDWQNLLDHFDFLRNREALHSHLTQQIHNRVMTWTILEMSIVVLMAVAQVAYWKKFFEQRRYL